jgi:hypothetical protein
LVDWLNNRLAQKSCNIKLKALRIMKYLVANGHPHFRQELRKRSQQIAEATKCSGPPDALRGNAPYLAVRKEAKELSEVLFMVMDDDSVVPVVQSTAVKLSGLGGSGQHGGGMQGFGNSPQAPERSLGESVMSGLYDIVEKVVDLTTPDKRTDMTFVPTDSRFSSFRPATIGYVESTEELSISENQKQHLRLKSSRQVPQRHKKGVAGGGWDDGPDNQPDQSSSFSSSSHGSSSAGLPLSKSDGCVHADYAILSDSTREDDWLVEKDLVNNIVSVDNDEIFPSRQQLRQFISGCQKTNCDKVVELLNTYFIDSRIAITMRSLLCLEALLRTDLVSVDYVAQKCSQHLVIQYKNSSSNEIRQKARKIIRILEKLAPNRAELFSDVRVEDNNILNDSHIADSVTTDSQNQVESDGITSDAYRRNSVTNTTEFIANVTNGTLSSYL